MCTDDDFKFNPKRMHKNEVTYNLLETFYYTKLIQKYTYIIYSQNNKM